MTEHPIVDAAYVSATNDQDGNPRRGWKVYRGGEFVGFVPENFNGPQALRDALDLDWPGCPGGEDPLLSRVNQLPETHISAAEYRALRAGLLLTGATKGGRS